MLQKLSVNFTALPFPFNTTLKFTAPLNAMFPETLTASYWVPRPELVLEDKSQTMVDPVSMDKPPSMVKRPGKVPGLKVPKMLMLPLTVPDPPKVCESPTENGETELTSRRLPLPMLINDDERDDPDWSSRVPPEMLIGPV